MRADENLLDRGSRLCVACGLCCQGALHNAASLLPEEAPLALGLGMKVARSGQDAQFALPCHLLKDRCCTVYADRPSPCRTYRCRLLRSLDAGENGLDDCLNIVSKAQSLVRDLQEVIPSDMTLPEARASAASPAIDDVGMLAKGKIRLHAFALSLYLEKYFRNENENSFLQTTRIDENIGSKP